MCILEKKKVCVYERMPHSLWARGVSTLVGLSSPGAEGEQQLVEYCVVIPWCHILEMLYIQIGCTWTIPIYISLNNTVIGSLFMK